MTEDLTLDANYEALREIGPWLSDCIGADHDSHGSIELAIHELATNSVDHAGSPDQRLRISGRVDKAETVLTVEIRDHGNPFDTASAPTPDPAEPQVGGYGLMIVEQLASELRYERAADENIWTASFAL